MRLPLEGAFAAGKEVRLSLESAFTAGKCVCRWELRLPLGLIQIGEPEKTNMSVGAHELPISILGEVSFDCASARTCKCT